MRLLQPVGVHLPANHQRLVLLGVVVARLLLLLMVLVLLVVLLMVLVVLVLLVALVVADRHRPRRRCRRRRLADARPLSPEALARLRHVDGRVVDPGAGEEELVLGPRLPGDELVEGAPGGRKGSL